LTRHYITWIAALCVTSCAAEDVATSIDEQSDIQHQGTPLHGLQMLGTQIHDMTMQGFQFTGATLNGAALVNVRIEHGELVAEQSGSTLHGTALRYAHLYAQVHNLTANPPTAATVEYQITNVETEDTAHDPTGTGATFLYTLAQNVDNTGSFQSACPVDDDGRQVAIPLTATWNEHGDRVESTTLFTFGCTAGAIAKCYRWGYRPWVTGYGDLVATHWSCTRLARADYCGNGTSHTRDGTAVNVWDNLGSPGPIQQHGGLLGLPPSGMGFEAGWSTGGAVCLSHARWVQGGTLLALACPDRLIPPSLLGGTVCDLVSQVLGNGSTSRIFNEAYLNLNLDLF
jgi:hypothetical protein